MSWRLAEQIEQEGRGFLVKQLAQRRLLLCHSYKEVGPQHEFDRLQDGASAGDIACNLALCVFDGLDVFGCSDGLQIS